MEIAVTEPFFRMQHFFFEWNEDDTTGATEVQRLPKDDVIEGLKKKNQSAEAGDGLIEREEDKKQKGEADEKNNKTFKDMITRTIAEYQKIIDDKLYKDKDDKARIESTIREL